MDISVELDAVGGEFNAFTAKEYTCFHARVLDDDLPLAVDVLGDMITNSLITEDDVEAERDVILDEIAMHDDDPDDVVHNLFAEPGLRRLAAGPADRRHRRVDRGAEPRPDRPLLPQPLPAANDGGRRGRQRRPRRRRAPGAHRLRPQRLPRPAPTRPKPAAARRPRPRGSPPAPSTRTRPFEQVNLVLGVKGMTRTDDRALRPRRAQHRPRRRHLLPPLPGGPRAARPGVLRVLVRQPLRRRRRRRASRSAACPPSSTTCSPSCARSWRKVAATASPRRSWSAARDSCAADWCSGSRTPARGCRGSARPSSSTTSCSASTTCWHASTRSPSRTSQVLAAELFAQPQVLAVVGPE